MKIALICPTNMLYMPYVNNYEKILKESNADYTIINWDRFHMENIGSILKHRDKKIGHQRNYFDYLKYKKFIIEKLNETRYDKLIIFGLQLTYFLKNYLVNSYKGKYIIDIRDHNKIIKLINIIKLIDNSTFTVISSPGYKLWLPESDKYIINHNTQIDNLEELRTLDIKLDKGKINISCIGAIRDYKVNIEFINSLKNKYNVNLFYHGDGIINDDIKKHLIDNKIENVIFTGMYTQEKEEELYIKSDFINVLRYNDGANNKTALPNRLYNSALYGKQMIALESTYLAEQIKEYKLGIVLDSFENIEEKINQYIKEFNEIEYGKKRVSFFEKVINDNTHFRMKLKEFIEIII